MPWFENRFGEKLWYEEAGSGIPLVFVHGWCMSSAVWQNQFLQLAENYRIIAPDLRGHGKSGGVHGQHDFGRYASDLSDLVKLLNLDAAILIGWSMGAQVALQVLSMMSDKLAGVVLISATPCFTNRDDFPIGLSQNESQGMRLKVKRNLQRALAGFHNRMFIEGEIETVGAERRIMTLLDNIVQPDELDAVGSLDALVDADMRTLLDDISTPVLVLNGDRDLICLPQASDYLTTRIKNATQRIFNGCGHAIFLTRSEQFNAEITKFAGRVRDCNA